MYSDKINSAKAAYGSEIKNKIVSSDSLVNVVLGFCKKEDLHGALQEDVFRLFDEYCAENKYPSFSHKAVGHVFNRLWNVQSKAVRVNGAVKKVYFY